MLYPSVAAEVRGEGRGRLEGDKPEQWVGVGIVRGASI